MNYEKELQESVNYLKSEKALHHVVADPYWPKWHSPWWHMLLLHEMEQVNLIPERLIEKYIESLNQIPVKFFPIPPDKIPESVDPYRGSPCHCQLGNVYQVLASWGVDVDSELPWIRPWFLRYQMEDGGFNCDEDAYVVKDEIPSSMVGMIAVFEAILFHTRREFTQEEKVFLGKGGKFLMDRKLIYGSQTEYNSDERLSAKEWLKPCFPRFYLYDVLRGLNALVEWSKVTQKDLPNESIHEAISYLEGRFPGGAIENERYSFSGAGTIIRKSNDEWTWQNDATFFPLLTRVSTIGVVSPFLSRQWRGIRARLSSGQQVFR